MATAQQVCPVVGTKNTILPPSHPEFNHNEKGLVCPVTNASTDHHAILQKHPGLGKDVDLNAQQCPVLKQEVEGEEAKKMDEGICPVVGIVSTVLPPDHPLTDGKSEVCPVTKATLKHHTDKVQAHPNIEEAAKGAVCPVVGKQ